MCKTVSATNQGKIVTKKLRSMFEEKFESFIGIGGTYAEQLQKMLSHKYCVILLGSNFKKKFRYERVCFRFITQFD